MLDVLQTFILSDSRIFWLLKPLKNPQELEKLEKLKLWIEKAIFKNYLFQVLEFNAVILSIENTIAANYK